MAHKMRLRRRWRLVCAHGGCSASSASDAAVRNSKYSIKVFGTGSSEVHPSVFVSSQCRSYLFNCGPGTFRDCFKISKEPVLFLTGASWEKVGGVLQLFHAANRSNGSEKGPEKFIKYLAPSNSREIMTQVLPRLTGRHSWKLHEDLNFYQDSEFCISGIEISLPGNKESVVVYSCRKLMVAPEKGEHAVVGNDSCTRNALPSLLQEGKKGSSFMIVDCPSKDFSNRICSHEKLSSQWFKDNGDVLDLIVHMTPLEVLETKEYCTWMASFGDGVHHLLVHSSVCPTEVMWRESMLLSIPLHLMNPEVYHFPQVPSSKPVAFTQLNMHHYLKESLVTIGCSRLQLDLNTAKPLSLNRSEVLKPLEPWLNGCFQQISASCRDNIENYHGSIGRQSVLANDFLLRKKPELSLSLSNDCIVTFLGTSATASTSFRNVCGILVQTLNSGYALLDCGESTLMQLYRCFGQEHARTILSNIQTIFISHLHPDHWFGLFEVLTEISSVKGSGRVDIIAPVALEMHLRSYNMICREMDYNFIDAKVASYYPHEHGGLSFKTIPVVHVRECYGIKISLGQNTSMVYSGDTKPCARLVEVGRNTDLLIHEATFYSTINDNANHSSYEQALLVAKEMNASIAILTHFTTKDCFAPLKTQPPSNVITAFDLMSVRLSDIKTNRLNSPEAFSIYKRMNRSL